VAHKSFFENLFWIAFPSGRRRIRCKWSYKTYQSILTKVIQQWRTFHWDKLDAVTAFSPVRAVASPTTLQQLNFHEIYLEYLLQQIKQIKGLLQGKRRAIMRDEQNVNLHERQKSLRRLDNVASLLSFWHVIRLMSWTYKHCHATLLDKLLITMLSRGHWINIFKGGLLFPLT
jgi:hypothetical protein